MKVRAVTAHATQREKEDPLSIIGTISVRGKCDDQALTSTDSGYRAAWDVPQTLKEAMSSSKSELWAEAMKDEFDSLKENNTFTLTTLLEGKHAVGEDGFTLSKTILLRQYTKPDM